MSEHSTGTKYLYHQDSRDLFKSAFKNRGCPHSRNVMAFIDSDEKSRNMKTFMNHLENCDACKQVLDTTQKTYERLDEFIPDARIPRNLQMEFESELSDILKNANFKSDPMESGKNFFKNLVETVRFSILGR